MELWIRNQDKDKLIKVDTIERVNNLIRCNNSDTLYLLGVYRNEDRASEVLDEIQSILNLKDMYKYDRELVLKSWENMDAEQVKTVRQQMSVYEMPKE